VRLQDLPPGCARLCLDVERFVQGELGLDLTGKRLVVAFSGGLDSTVLLHLAVCLARKHGGTSLAAHLDHTLRPGSGAEAATAAAICRGLGLPCRTGAADVAGHAREHGQGIEEAGRTLRYRFLRSVMEEESGDYLLVAHHLDDLAEDLLLRLIRGANWPELAGMPAWDPERQLLRPLLLTPRERLLGFAQSLGSAWSEDESNLDSSFRRNRVRADILPLFLRENPNFLSAASRLWRLARIDKDYWQEAAGGEAEESAGGLFQPAAALEGHPARRLRLLKAGLDTLGPGQALTDNLIKLERAWEERRLGARVQFPGSKTATVTPEGIQLAGGEASQTGQDVDTGDGWS
jgi:tRNA(Ile)-lysidine synthase